MLSNDHELGEYSHRGSVYPSDPKPVLDARIRLARYWQHVATSARDLQLHLATKRGAHDTEYISISVELSSQRLVQDLVGLIID